MPIAEPLSQEAQDVTALLRSAWQMQQAGRLDDADRLYREVLAHTPNHREALHLAGVLAFERGRLVEALELLDGALVRAPRFVEAQIRRGEVLCAMGRPDEAIGAYRQAILLERSSSVAWCRLGDALCDLGRPDEALRAYRESLTHAPDSPLAHLRTATVLRQLGLTTEALSASELAVQAAPESALAHDLRGCALRDVHRLDEAIEAHLRAVALDPTLTEGFVHLGAALCEAGRHNEAATALQAALALDARHAGAHDHMGQVLRALGYIDQAIAAHRQALAERPDFSEAHYHLGVLLAEVERPAEALASLRAALEFRPDHADAHVQLGGVLLRLDRPGEAVRSYQRALELAPEQTAIWSALGVALQEDRRPGEAAEAFGQVLRLRPTEARAHWRRSLSLLSTGQYEEGWEEFEWRWQVPEVRAVERHGTAPRWDGSPLAGRTLLVQSEVGLGETIQFARFLPMLAERGGRVVLECQPSLRRLLEAMPCVAQVVGQGEPLPPHQCHVPLLSLPRLLAAQPGAVPADVPYLSPVTRSGRIPVLPALEGLRVGLVWGGASRASKGRSLPLEAVSPLLSMEGIAWYSLQLGEPAVELPQVPAAAGMCNLAPLIRDFVDTAALACQLDLIITVDTAVAHLAGALGLNAWVLLGYAPEWTWYSTEGRSPWYPTARLFRQSRPGDWDGVVEEVRLVLADLQSATPGRR